MNVYYPNDPRDPAASRGLALGFFDGVHRGHQDLIRTLVYNCERLNLRPAIFTFPEHPLITISPEGQFPGYLSTLDQRLQRIAETGAEEVFLENFTPEFAAMPPLEFLDTILAGQLNARLIVVGQDYRFGHDGEGDLQLLSEWASQHNIEVIAVPDVQLHGSKISSSRIRRLISEGDAQMAASCLGTPFQMTGIVIEGKKLGRKLGFPTANIAIARDLAIP
ncbi:MAG: ribF, partial [Firmicutes bacterium]|nr:ribF [Bacillota bacterium]